MTDSWKPQAFSSKVITYYHAKGRKDLPWHNTKDAYRIWLSEVMLQQTQVKTVIPYYQNFLKTFPTITSLADADVDRVLHLWSGLGYYSRARNLHKAAQMVRDEFNGEFPQSQSELETLPGVGRSTAGAIAAFAYDKPTAILDGNVKRVLARCFAIEGWYGQTKVLNKLWGLSEQLTPKKETAAYNQAMMDIGAVVCKRSNPECLDCPLTQKCQARLQNRTKELPHKKPKRARPSKSVYWQLYLQGKKILLTKRPPSGIWGGLWSIPEIEIADYTPKTERKLEPILHKFSHYDLKIQPLIMKSKPNMSIMESNLTYWFSLTQPESLGLPTPVSNLLNTLKESL
ncbi:A/G-specific adenine glycosylase [Kangiella sp. HZ709]|uniref:A/G-specific adenine glycosylase n=1 Tax=Kangiella sp. HZ709 TaxID=2666328 RepID=UPI001416109B|nr:A/G-specific adenine glycosylase [Kangiella sp. HZ709]